MVEYYLGSRKEGKTDRKWGGRKDDIPITHKGFRNSVPGVKDNDHYFF